jgi:hypothetical protein
MSTSSNSAMLHEYEYEDIFDVVFKLEKSFGLKFNKYDFYYVQQFGDLCDVFHKHLPKDYRQDCTSQQAFYRVRKAMAVLGHANELAIWPNTQLAELFPSGQRRQQVRAFEWALGVKLDVLAYPGWLLLFFMIGFLVSFITVFFYWPMALAGMVFFVLTSKLAKRMANTFKLTTVRDLVNELTMQHYQTMRRRKGSINPQEATKLIVDAFISQLHIDKENLTPAHRFSWAI